MYRSCEPDDRACQNERRYFQKDYSRPNPFDLPTPKPTSGETPKFTAPTPKSTTTPPRPDPTTSTPNPTPNSDRQAQTRNTQPIRFPKRITPTAKELPLEARQKANMILGSREALRKDMDAAQKLLDDRNVGATIDRELSTQESLVLVDEDAHVTIAYRGTEPGTNKHSLDDIRNDANIAFGRESFPDSEAQYERAVAKYGQVDEVAGYSLGGNRALTISQKYGTKATLFNPWLGPKTLANDSPNVKIYRTTEDYATAIGMGPRQLANFDVDTVHPIQEVQTNPLRVDVHSLENFTETSPRVATSHAEDIHTMMKTVSQHQDFQTVHEISKAIEDGQSFTEWMQANEAADVTTDGFTERVNRSDFRAKYWNEAGGKFSESEQSHLDDTPATEEKDEGERGRQRARFASKPVEEQASFLEGHETKVKTAIEKVNASTTEHHAVLKEYTKAGQFLRGVHPVNVGTGLVISFVADKIIGAIDKDKVQPEAVRELETGALAGAGSAAVGAALTGTALTAAAIPEIVAGGLGFVAGAETTKGIDAGLRALGTEEHVSGAVSSAVGGGVGGGVSAATAIGGASLMGAEIGEFGGPVGLAVGSAVGATIGLGTLLVSSIFG